MNTITIPKKEYDDLLSAKIRIEYLRQIFEEDFFASPPTKNVKDIIKAFKQTGKYNEDFINSIENGLKRSSYFNKRETVEIIDVNNHYN